MSEIETLKARIDASKGNGLSTAYVREDYEPIGATMIRDLVNSGDYVTQKVRVGVFEYEWRIYKVGHEPN